MGRKRKRRLGLARRARSDLPAIPFPQAKQPIPYAPPAGLDCAMAGMQKSAQGKFCGDKLRRARKNGDIAIGQKTPRERRQKKMRQCRRNASCRLYRSGGFKLRLPPETRRCTGQSGGLFGHQKQSRALGKSVHPRGGNIQRHERDAQVRHFLKPSDSGERARL